jgi:hypothetical protein
VGIKKRIEKLETLRVQNYMSIDDLVIVFFGVDGYPEDEKNAEILRQAEAARAGRQGIYAICVCHAGAPGPYYTARPPPLLLT